MAFTHSTNLGRRVLIEDWLGFHRDRLLGVLYITRDSNGDGSGFSIEQIAHITGLNESDAFELVRSMKTKPKLVESTAGNLVAITERGVRWVEESPSPPRVGDGC